ncbi:actin-associated protein FAM107A [Brachionichthys hirsutus]|uniref:actin-associated protein FAM107A n=1 Tax=Brachionichthys hirsutus TaxID=412623 RepID=UPI003604440D
MSVNGSYSNNASRLGTRQASGSRTTGSTPHSSNHRRDNRIQAEAASGRSDSVKTSQTHNELHKELLLAHKRGLALSSRSELQRVLERRKRVQSAREEEAQGRTPLEDELLRRQQRQREKEKEQEKVPEEAQLMEFVRIRQNLRKIHSAMHNKVANAQM